MLEEGSLSGAARRLGVSQPTARAHVEALERALGAVLFTRSSQGLLPTEQARAVHNHVRAMAHASEAFVRAVSAAPGEAAGAVRVSASEFVGLEVLPPMLARSRVRHKDLRQEVVTWGRWRDIHQELPVQKMARGRARTIRMQSRSQLE